MTILVTGSTGTIGAQVVAELAQRGAAVRALTRLGAKTSFPAGVTEVAGDMMDVDSMRTALHGIDTLFLLNAVAADELTQALVTLDLARDAGIERIVYFSVFNGALFADVPHFTGKNLVERVIDEAGLPATVLRPAYFFQNDARLRDVIAGAGVYPMPVGSVGLNMVDVRDIAAVAALELIRRESADAPLPRAIIPVVGPDRLTGPQIASLWSDALGRDIAYAGDDLDAFEAATAKSSPGWMAHDLRMMARGFQRDGMVASPSMIAALQSMLGRPLRTYRDFARETVTHWRAA